MSTNQIKRKIKKIPGIFFVYQILAYTIVSPILNAARLIQIFFECKVLKWSNRMDHAGFIALSAGTWPFYYRVALAFSSVGRNGIYPYLSIGNYLPKKGFHYVQSLAWFWKANNHFVIISLFVWWLSYLFWITEVNIYWVFFIMFVTLLSTTFVGVFSRMNYNALGWSFFPLGLYGLETEQSILVGIAWLCTSFGSFTVFTIACIYTISTTIITFSFWPLFTLIPAILKLTSNIIPLIRLGTEKLENKSSYSLKNTFFEIAKAIGLYQGENVRYKRPKSEKSLLSFNAKYFFVVYFLFLLSYFLTTKAIPVFFIIGFVIFIINTSFARFADEQSMWMLMLTVSAMSMIQLNNGFDSYLMLLPFWIMLSPLPRLFFVGNDQERLFWKIPSYKPLKPIYIKPILQEFEGFFSGLRENSRVLMALKDPMPFYTKVFDGLRFHVEFPLYVASLKRIHLFPDWFAVFETNYEGAPNFWGREPYEVLKNMKYWDADYAMIYQIDNEDLDIKWNKAGFSTINQVNFKKALFTPREVNVSWWLLQHSESIDKRILY